MSKRKVPEFDYAATFDRLMGEQFCEAFKTQWSLLEGSWGGYQTRRVNGKRMTKAHALYGRGLSNGIAAARP